jgi:hypothetical protein
LKLLSGMTASFVKSLYYELSDVEP